MNAAKTATATWKTQYQVVFAASTGGSVTPSTATWYDSGSSGNSISATAASGYQFAQWTTTGSVTIADSLSSSTTLTVNGAGTVTANFQAQVIPTWMSITCTPPTVNKAGSMDTAISGKLALASDHNTGVEGKTITITYFDGLNWQPIATTTTGTGGSYSADWTAPSTLANGFYPIKATFSGDLVGSAPEYTSSEAVTGNSGQGILVVPEYAFGALAALGTCVGSFVFFKKRRSSS